MPLARLYDRHAEDCARAANRPTIRDRAMSIELADGSRKSRTRITTAASISLTRAAPSPEITGSTSSLAYQEDTKGSVIALGNPGLKGCEAQGHRHARHQRAAGGQQRHQGDVTVSQAVRGDGRCVGLWHGCSCHLDLAADLSATTGNSAAQRTVHQAMSGSPAITVLGTASGAMGRTWCSTGTRLRWPSCRW